MFVFWCRKMEKTLPKWFEFELLKVHPLLYIPSSWTGWTEEEEEERRWKDAKYRGKFSFLLLFLSSIEIR